MAIEGGCETLSEIEGWTGTIWGHGEAWLRMPMPYRYIREARQKLKKEQSKVSGGEPGREG